MIKKLKILLFPALTILFLFAAWLFDGPALRILLAGERADGNIVALIRCYEKQCDLLIDITQDLVLTQADGEQIVASADRDGIQQPENYTTEQLAVLDVVKAGKADGIQRFLQRQAEKESAERIVNVLRKETTTLRVDLATPIAADAYKASEGADQLITRIECTYIGGTPEEAELKTDVKRETSRTLNGTAVEHDSQDFILYETDFRYAFRPVFSYENPTGSVAVIADIGARMSPRGGHNLGDEVKVSYLPEAPERAVMLSDFSVLKEQGFMDAINTFFNITFGQWFFSAVSLLLAFVYFVMSWITISLAIKPPKTENADTVDEEALRNEG